MHLGKKNLRTTYYINGTVLERREGLGNIRQWRFKVDGVSISYWFKANCAKPIEYYVWSTEPSPAETKEYYWAFTRRQTHLEYCSPAWSPIAIPQKGQTTIRKSSATLHKMLPGLKSLEYEDRLKVLGIWSLEERRNRADLLEAFKIKSGFSVVPFDTLLEVDSQQKTRGHTWKISKHQSNLDVWKYFFSERAVDRGNKLEHTDVDCGSISSFKNKLEGIRKTRIGFFMD